jgi:hypothetical protein
MSLAKPGAVQQRVRVQGDLFHGLVPDGAVYVGRAAPGLKRSRYANPFRAAACGRKEPSGCTAST